MGKDDKQDEKIETLGYPLRMLAQARLFITSKLLAGERRIGASKKINTGLGCGPQVPCWPNLFIGIL
jgi:hypothetical protein